jgi:DoxX-like family
MQPQTTKTFQHATDEKSATVARSRWNWSRIRPIAFWATTFVVVFELAAGSVWNLVPIEWIEVQLDHLGYPHFFAYILGAWQAGAAVAIIAPRLPLIKEWAYIGSFFLWSGAVASHLSAGDGVGTALPTLDRMGPVRRNPVLALGNPVLALGPFRSRSSLFCMPFRSYRCPRSKSPCTSGQLSSAGSTSSGLQGLDVSPTHGSATPSWAYEISVATVQGLA